MLQNRDTLLITDVEREQALARLREACVEGQLTLDEFSERVDAVLAARTQADLAPAIADVTARRPSMEVEREETERVIAIMGDAKRKGRWRIGPQTKAFAIMGDCQLDLRQAEVTSSEVEITAYALMGDVKVIVPEGVDVELTGVAFMGDKKYKVADVRPLPGGPLIRVRAYAVMGDVKVESKR